MNAVAIVPHTPPAGIRKAEVSLLMRVFARAFDVEPPSLRGLSADEALQVFRAFTAACMELALKDERTACYLRSRLGQEAQRLGRHVRRYTPLGLSGRRALARYLYRGIGIELGGALPAAPCFGPCCFATRYTPRTCWLMSAFDEGFLQGLWAREQASLVFSCRLTEGADCCRARFEARKD